MTTLRLGGPAERLVAVDSEEQLIETIRTLDDASERVLILGGGSNVVIADEGFAGTVVHVCTRGVASEVDACSGATVTVQAGERWDDFVEDAVAHDWVGIEALAGIPGLVGAVPIQNVGAYGQEVSQTIARVRTYDRRERRIVTHTTGECGFAYRHSKFKAEPHRYVVLAVTFQFRLGDRSAPVRYAELAKTLGVQAGERARSSRVREAVLALRRGKGMVLDEADHDTWSAGSFFTNPVLPAEQSVRLPADAPRFPQPDGTTKTSAAWLIDHAGFAKGHSAFGGRVRLSSKHTLALTNRGGATTAELLGLAREIRTGVRTTFGVELVNEPVLVGCTL